MVEGILKAEGSGMPAGSEPVGAGAFTRYTNWDWDETQDQLIAGQQTALGLSIQGISPTQLQTLQTRMEATKATLEQAQAAPQNQRATILQGRTGDHLTGNLLTATIWGYFASLQSHGAIAQQQGQRIYSINAQNAATALPALPIGIATEETRKTVLAGKKRSLFFGGVFGLPVSAYSWCCYFQPSVVTLRQIASLGQHSGKQPCALFLAVGDSLVSGCSLCRFLVWAMSLERCFVA